MNKLNIFIPAAGFGERLRPITFHIPKPLLPISGKPVLQSVLERVSDLPVNKIGINLHHKKEMIEEWMRKYYNTPLSPLDRGESSPALEKGDIGGFSDKIVFFREETILGTGGALKNAEAFLKEGAFLVHNSDILSDTDLEKLLEHHFLSGNLVTLAVHDYPEFNNVIVDEKGFLTGIKNPSNSPLKGGVAFTGIAVYRPEFLQFLPAGPSSVVDAWLTAVNTGQKIGTFDVGGCSWSDIGTPAAYASSVFNLLKAEGETVYVHPSVRGCGNVEMQGYVVIEEGCNAGTFRETSLLRNCILLPDVGGEQLPPSVSPLTKGGIKRGLLENCIIGPDFKIDLIEPEILAASFDDDMKLIGAGGSDRKYYRIKKGRKSAVLMQCRRDDPDFDRQIEYTKFFLKYFIPVPDVLEVDQDEKRAVFEDAGDTSLYNWLKCPREDAEIESMYRKVIDALALIHTTATDHVAECPSLKGRLFDYEYFRWETAYFLERFLEGARNIQVDNVPGLEEELNGLAFKADSFPKTIIHRDFQSQNIMVTRDGGLRIIDFQGARMGPSAYDVASILWDPYCRLEDGLRGRLADYYICKIEDKFDADYFRETLIVCKLQRHMQALGAYGYLSLVKGKKYFLKYVPEGLRLLKEDGLSAKDEYPELYKLIICL